RLNGSDTEPRLSLECHAFDRPLAGDRRVDRQEEPEAFRKATDQPNDDDRLLSLPGFYCEVEVEPLEACSDLVDDCDVRIANAQDSAGATSFCVKNPCQKALPPLIRGVPRPTDDLLDGSHGRQSRCADRVQCFL